MPLHLSLSHTHALALTHPRFSISLSPLAEIASAEAKAEAVVTLLHSTVEGLQGQLGEAQAQLQEEIDTQQTTVQRLQARTGELFAQGIRDGEHIAGLQSEIESEKRARETVEAAKESSEQNVRLQMASWLRLKESRDELQGRYDQYIALQREERAKRAVRSPATPERRGRARREAPGSPAMCVICLAEPKTHAFAPCFHRCLCGGCSQDLVQRSAVGEEPSLARCPICRAEADYAGEVYM